MRIIFLNIWHGIAWEKLESFVRKESKGTDIFCFVEVHSILQNKLRRILKDFNPIYFKGRRVVFLGGIDEGESVFVSKKIKINSSLFVSLYKSSKSDAGGMIYVNLSVGGRNFHLGALHGKSEPSTKLDTPVRIRQSEKILKFFDNKQGPKIVGGDFNLHPQTNSVKMFEESGYRNLIKDFGVRQTRSKLAWEYYKNNPDFVKQYFADYVFVSPEIKVNSFEVPNVEVSDHEPLILDFEI